MSAALKKKSPRPSALQATAWCAYSSGVWVVAAIGLACGMGYVAFGAVFAVILAIVSMIYDKVGFLEKNDRCLEKTLKVITEKVVYIYFGIGRYK